jgi:hypothetical protein
MDSISNAQPDGATDQDTKRVMSDMDVGEEDAIRKVEAANTPDQTAQNGVKNVEAVTLTWTKKSLACAFAWYVRSLIFLLSSHLVISNIFPIWNIVGHNTSLLYPFRKTVANDSLACGLSILPTLSSPPSPPI